MQKIGFIIIAFMSTGFIFPDDSCHPPGPGKTTYDGPYVLYKRDRMFVNYITRENGIKKVEADSLPVSQKDSVSLRVLTDDSSKTFTVKLKQQLTTEPTEFPQPGKLFALSDIEGNFRAFKKLLQAGGVIDSNFNWTFGNGHLVLIGDFVDRGTQVTEVLWLIYSLEDKAKQAGGYVHYILGNHEIMNMSGDLRYVQPKYFESANLMDEGYTSLFGENAELGRWLRTKNVMEKIGEMLFMHGGISAPVNRMNLPVPRINDLIRPYYADSTFVYENPRTETLFGEFGPFWYRGYYLGLPDVETGTIDSTLSIYNVKHIATGHTIVADTVSAWYNGKVLNTDVHHAGGHSEALLIEDKKFYRVSPSGVKTLLFEN